MRKELDVSTVRIRVAQLVWALCAIAAVLLALGALTFALKANAGNTAVEFVRDAADFLDLGVFDMHNGVKEFSGDSADVKNALFNWGLAAVVWLVIGRIADRLIRP